MIVAALYVQSGGAYYGLPDVDPWSEAEDARTYHGPWPVVAHPPCARWCRLAKWAHDTRGAPAPGDDGGCFAAALAAVRRWGGVLEHPAHSAAWAAHGLNRPPAYGWVVADFEGGLTCQVDQSNYGHRAPKATWLYAHGFEPPSLVWAPSDARYRTRRRGRGAHGEFGGASVELLSRRERNATPQKFRDLLVGMARSVPVPLWVPCPCCDEFLCTEHRTHVFDCDCPAIENMATDPYTRERPR